MLGKIDGKRRMEWDAEEEMVRSHYRFKGHEFKQTPGDSGGQGSLSCCSPWGGKLSDIT